MYFRQYYHPPLLIPQILHISHLTFNCLSLILEGFEVTVSKNLYVTNNDIHNNVVGIGLYHPNMAGTNPDYSSYDSWIFENNHVYDNNLPNTAPSGTFQAALQSGIGLLLVGISEHTIKNNVFEDNGWAGVRQCRTIL